MFKRKKHKKNELFIYVMMGVIFIVTLFGCINVYNSCKIINNQANTNLTYLAEDIKQHENNYFRVAEDAAENSRKTIELTINNYALNKIAPSAHNYGKYNIPYVGSYLNLTVSPLLLYSSNRVEGLVSTYFIFDPEFLTHKDLIGLWYTDPHLEGDFEITDNGPKSDMYPQNKSDLGWFYVPKKLKKGAWGEPYIDRDIKIEMITYSTPVYSGQKFLGVVGVDISMDEIKKFICKFEIYETGKAYLIDKNNKIIFAKDHKVLTSTSVIDKNLHAYLNKEYSSEVIKVQDEEIALVKSTSAEKLYAVTRLYNGFVLVLEAPAKELYAETEKLIGFTFYLIILAALIISLITIEANRYIKKINNGLLHKEKLMSLGTVVAEIAHEINNPIGYISCNLDTLKKFIAKIKTFMISYEQGLNNILAEKKSPENAIKREVENIETLKTELKIDYVIESLDELIDESKEGVKRVSEIVINLKNFAVDDRQDVKTSEYLNKLVDESLAFLNGKIKPEIEVVKIFGDTPPIRCNKNQLEQVLINLIDNARYAVEKNGAASKKISIRTYKKGQNAFIEIEDNGGGIEKSTLNRIFDPFFTTKSQGEGTGLGLSIAYEIITKKHKGEISVESQNGSGTKFTIKLPY